MADTIMRIVFFVWFLYRHSYHSYELGRAECKYNILSSGLHSGIIQDENGVRHVTEEDLKDSYYMTLVSSAKFDMKMHKLFANLSAFICAMYLLYFIIN